jgi:plastocyanin
MLRLAAAMALLGGLLLPAARAAATAVPGSVVVAFLTDYHTVSTDPLDEDVEVQVTQGQTLLFANADPIAPHTLSAVPDQYGNYLFDSNGGEANAPGSAATVDGVESLPPGRYEFQCKFHTSLMQGWLTVVPSGSLPAGPAAKKGER